MFKRITIFVAVILALALMVGPAMAASGGSATSASCVKSGSFTLAGVSGSCAANQSGASVTAIKLGPLANVCTNTFSKGATKTFSLGFGFAGAEQAGSGFATGFAF